jgi:CheY-like chemotaxis protein
MDTSDITILIVDDNPVNVKLGQALLEREGYRTVSALDGRECLETAKRLKPDLILLDIFMPEISGIEVCKALRRDIQTRPIPVVFLTANTDNKILKAAFESGGRDYVRKPVNKTELLLRIKCVLDQEKLGQTLLEEEKLKAVLEMAGAVCHELNQPMQTVAGYAQILIMNTDPEDPLAARVEKIKQQIDRMGKITRKLTRITRYETKDYILGKKIIDIDKASI